jgi:hypothetical protein
LNLERGVPSHDTFGRVFARIDPDAFERCFGNWMASLKDRHAAEGMRLIAIDGKSIRRSFEHAWDKSGMVHLVSAFAECNRMVFAQVATDSKANERGGRRDDRCVGVPEEDCRADRGEHRCRLRAGREAEPADAV